MVKEERNRPCRLKMVEVRVYRTRTQPLLETGEMPNLMLDKLADEISITMEDTNRKVTMAYGKNATVLGMISDVPVSFDGKVALMKFMVVDGLTVDVIVGYHALQSIQENWTLETSPYPLRLMRNMSS